MRSTKTLQLVLVALVASPDGGLYGYDLIRDHGLKSGTVYPILDRLEKAGWISGEWRPGVEGRPPRRNYKLTAEGVSETRLMLSPNPARAFNSAVVGTT